MSNPRRTIKAINEAVAAAGISAELVRGKGYFYFVGAAVDTANEQGVYGVFRLGDLTIEQWVEEARSRAVAVDEAAVQADANFAEEVYADIKSGKQQVIDSVVELQTAAPGTYIVTGTAAAHMAKLVAEQLVREHNTFKPPVRPYAKSYHNRVVTAMTAETKRLTQGKYHKTSKVKLVAKLARYAERAA